MRLWHKFLARAVYLIIKILPTYGLYLKDNGFNNPPWLFVFF